MIALVLLIVRTATRARRRRVGSLEDEKRRARQLWRDGGID